MFAGQGELSFCAGLFPPRIITIYTISIIVWNVCTTPQPKKHEALIQCWFNIELASDKAVCWTFT